MKEEIIRLHKLGFTYNQIRIKLGCSKSTISYHCGEGQKSKSSERNLERKRKNKIWLEKYKEKLTCSNCPESRFWVLDFHHSDPTSKEKTVAQMIKSASKRRVIAEIAKCKVLCSNCHRDLHYNEKLSKE